MPTMFLALKMSKLPSWLDYSKPDGTNLILLLLDLFHSKGIDFIQVYFLLLFVGLYFSVAHLFKHSRGKFKLHSSVSLASEPMLLLYPPQLLCNFPPSIAMFFLSRICTPS